MLIQWKALLSAIFSDDGNDDAEAPSERKLYMLHQHAIESIKLHTNREYKSANEMIIINEDADAPRSVTPTTTNV
jgi:hypothetical protein